MKPSEKQIQHEIKRLRKIINTSLDPLICKIAYERENTLRWAIEDTVGWPVPSSLKDIELMANQFPSREPTAS